MRSGARLAELAGLHLAWGAGASFAARDRMELASVIAGTDSVPFPRDRRVVGGLLALAAGRSSTSAPVRGRRAEPACSPWPGWLGAHGLTGVLGRTAVLVPWEPSPPFVRIDRHYYGPLCLALAVGACSSLRA